MKTKSRRKLAALFFAICMALSFVPIATFATEPKFPPQGVTYSNGYNNTYHIQVNVIANVTVKDSTDKVIETTQVSKSTEDFLEGNIEDDALQTMITNFQTEIETPYKSRGTVTRETGTYQSIFDHFETATFYKFTPTSGDTIDFKTDLEQAKQYFNEHQDATGTFEKFFDVHEYQQRNYTYDLTVQTNSKVIDLVEINDVTVNFKDGDKPVFTGKVPDGADYAYRCEWWELDRKTGAMSTDFGNFYENKFTNFEAGKTYHYGVYVTTIYGDRYVFGPNTKLKINGEFVNYKRYEGDDSDGSNGIMWVITDLAMTPQATEKATKYEVIEGANGTWMQNSDKELRFRINGDISKFVGVKVDDEWLGKENYVADAGSTIVTLKNEYLKNLSVGEHKITFVYTDGEASTNFEVKESEKIYENSDISEPNIPKTGDNINVNFWIMNALGMLMLVLLDRKKKYTI